MDKLEKCLKRIINILLLNASFTDNLGLLNGKLGISIFFYHYYRYTGNKIFEEYAEELIDEIYEEINTSTPVDFTDGLSGIGWGIDYLIKNKFVDAETDEALAEIDNSLFQKMLDSPFSIDTGNDFFGYAIYCYSRFKGHENDDKKKKYFLYLIDECERLLIGKQIPEFNFWQLNTAMVNSILWFLLEIRKIHFYTAQVNNILKSIPDYISEQSFISNSSADLSFLLELSQKASEELMDEDIQKKYIHLADRIMLKLRGNIIDDKIMLSYLQSKIIQSLIYSVNKSDTNRDKDLFIKTLLILDDEFEWNKIITGLNKSNLSLTGLAGTGLLLMSHLKERD